MKRKRLERAAIIIGVGAARGIRETRRQPSTCLNGCDGSAIRGAGTWRPRPGHNSICARSDALK